MRVSPIAPHVFQVCLLLLTLCAVGACDDLSGYQGDFAGGIVKGNFVRSCFPSWTRATLHFDPEFAVAPLGDARPSQLNRLTTTDGTFDKTLLEPITALPNDQLSDFTFPGPRRLRNFLLLARPSSGPLVGRDATVVVSLLENGHIEVRVIARSADTTEACPTESEASEAGTAPGSDTAIPRPREYFGVFGLK